MALKLLHSKFVLLPISVSFFLVVSTIFVLSYLPHADPVAADNTQINYLYYDNFRTLDDAVWTNNYRASIVIDCNSSDPFCVRIRGSNASGGNGFISGNFYHLGDDLEIFIRYRQPHAALRWQIEGVNGCSGPLPASSSTNFRTHTLRCNTLPAGSYIIKFHMYGNATGWIDWLETNAIPFPLLDTMVMGGQTDCPLCSAHSAQATTHGINTGSGNWTHHETDMSLTVAGSPIQFSRHYASQRAALQVSGTLTNNNSLGEGWVHNYDVQLVLDSSQTALTNTIELQTPSGSRLPFIRQTVAGDVSYMPYAGVTAELIENTDGSFTVTGFNQATYTFNAVGQMTSQQDANGNTITFSYHTSGNGVNQLYRAQQNGRYLEYQYRPDGRLGTVADHTGRQITLDYTNDRLSSVTSPLNVTTTYTYQDHLLTQVTDPTGKILREVAYDSENRAIQVRDGHGNVLSNIDYTDTIAPVVQRQGVSQTHTYNQLGTWVGTTPRCQDGTAGCEASHSTGYDGNFKVSGTSDANGNPSILNWNAGGSNLESVTNALEQTTEFEYDEHNNLTHITNADGTTTIHAYDHSHLPTFRTSTTNSAGHTTYFTPTYQTQQNGVTVPDGLLLSQEDTSGVVTNYEYNEYGQVLAVTHSANSAQPQTSTYTYDALGRVQTSTSPEGQTSLNIYDTADRLTATINNWTGSDPATWLNECVTTPGVRDTNICTRYGYDAAGRTISTTDTLGRTSLTFYDDAGRNYLTISNYDGTSYTDPQADLCDWDSPDAEYNLCALTEYDSHGRAYRRTDALGRVSLTAFSELGRVEGTIQNSVNVTTLNQCQFPPAQADRDLCTLFTYDAVGNVLTTTDPSGQQSYTIYDELNRAVGTISNWAGTMTTTAQVTNSCFNLNPTRTSDLCTLTSYDEVGNVILTTDVEGRQTRTFYNDLNQVTTMVSNYQDGFDPAACVYDPDNMAEKNICTQYGYDSDGRQTSVTNALGQTSLTVYDEQSRPVVSVANWDGTTPIQSEADCAFPPAQADTNVCQVTYYDANGRRVATKNALGQLTDYGFDSLGRTDETTRYLAGQPVQNKTQFDALGNRLFSTDAENHTTSYQYDTLNRLTSSESPMGVTTSQTYNALSWVVSESNDAGHTTSYQYDEQGHLLSTTDPLQYSTYYQYDARGNQTGQVDAEDVLTTYLYDDLNRLVGVVENDTGGVQTDSSNVLTQYQYDISGNRLVITNARSFTQTLTSYDVLGRPVVVTDTLGNETTYQYDALGRVRQMVDGNSALTTYAYDGLNRVISTTYHGDNETILNTYNALGNRLAMSDATGITSYQYDDLNRPITVTSPLTGTVVYGYDLNGNRTNLTYPDGKVVSYYNGLVKIGQKNERL